MRQSFGAGTSERRLQSRSRSATSNVSRKIFSVGCFRCQQVAGVDKTLGNAAQTAFERDPILIRGDDIGTQQRRDRVRLAEIRQGAMEIALRYSEFAAVREHFPPGHQAPGSVDRLLEQHRGRAGIALAAFQVCETTQDVRRGLQIVNPHQQQSPVKGGFRDVQLVRFERRLAQARQHSRTAVEIALLLQFVDRHPVETLRFIEPVQA